MPHQFAGAVLREVGEDGGAGPDGADVGVAVGIFDEVVAGFAGVVGGVVCWEVGDVEVGDEDGVEVLLRRGRGPGLGRSGKFWVSTVKGRFLSW